MKRKNLTEMVVELKFQLEELIKENEFYDRKDDLIKELEQKIKESNEKIEIPLARRKEVARMKEKNQEKYKGIDNSIAKINNLACEIEYLTNYKINKEIEVSRLTQELHAKKILSREFNLEEDIKKNEYKEKSETLRNLRESLKELEDKVKSINKKIEEYTKNEKNIKIHEQILENELKKSKIELEKKNLVLSLKKKEYESILEYTEAEEIDLSDLTSKKNEIQKKISEIIENNSFDEKQKFTDFSLKGKEKVKTKILGQKKNILETSESFISSLDTSASFSAGSRIESLKCYKRSLINKISKKRREFLIF